jgi:hypothetical protein
MLVPENWERQRFVFEAGEGRGTYIGQQNREETHAAYRAYGPSLPHPGIPTQCKDLHPALGHQRLNQDEHGKGKGHQRKGQVHHDSRGGGERLL